MLNVVIGAVLALSAQVMLQLVIVPRVESWKRRDDRWERDVLELGGLLTGEIAVKLQSCRIATGVLLHVVSRGDASEDGLRKLRKNAIEASNELAALNNSQIDWLTFRIAPNVPDSLELVKFWLKAKNVTVKAGFVTSGYYSEGVTEDSFNRYAEEYQEAVKELVEEVKKLAVMRHRPTRRRRLAGKRLVVRVRRIIRRPERRRSANETASSK